MAVFNAPIQGGTISGSGLSDIIHGSAFADNLSGSGANDTINGNDGDDIINGDGGVSYADAIASLGYTLSTFLGAVTSTTGLQLTSMGTYNGQSVWRIRNASDTAEKIAILQSASQGTGNNGAFAKEVTLPPNSEMIILSTHVGTHKLMLNGKQVDVKAVNLAPFDASSLVTGIIDGDDIIDGGAGNDTIDGGGGNDTIHGDDGNDTITGGRGDDVMSGGAGNDTFLAEWADTGDKYNGGDGIDMFKIDGTEVQGYVQEIDLATGTNNWSDTFTSIENIIGGTGNDKFWGSSVDNVFYGKNGNDLLDGRGGNDALFGEEGDDTLIGGEGNDNLNGGNGVDLLVGGAGADTLVGGAGVDTADYSASAAGVTVNLTTGLGAGGDAAGDVLSEIEKLIGSNAADILTGDAKANVISAGAGNDVVFGSGGGDTIDGGSDNDTTDYSNSTAAVTVSLVTGLGLGGFAQGDVLSNVENLTGSKYADRLTGNAGQNTLNGGAGDDVLIGGAGADILIGGTGNDTADYSASLEAINVNLASGVVSGGDAAGDNLTDIESIIATGFADILTGNALANRLYAGAGNDVIYGSGGGDIIDGGADLDLLDYTGSNAAVTVNLTTGAGLGGWAQGDVISNVENINGSKFDDIITGSASDNVINGGLGADRLLGADGSDVLNGNEGNDALYGDAGIDTLSGGIGNDRLTGGIGADVLNGNEGTDTADYRHSSAGVDVSIIRGTGLLGDAEGDTLQFIENLSGSAFADTLVGDDGVNRLSGMSGEDRLYGLGGNDYFSTGGGYDFVDGGDGVDTVTYEDSWDHVVVNLTTGKNQYGEASRDVLVNVENIIGSAFDDTITGDAGANRLTGGAGADAMNGMAGIDYLYGGAGNDVLTGGTGADVFVFELGFGDDTITDFWAGAGRTDRIWFQSNGTINPASVSWHVVDTAAGAVITVDGHGSLTLTGVTVAQLQADDFIFS